MRFSRFLKCDLPYSCLAEYILADSRNWFSRVCLAECGLAKYGLADFCIADSDKVRFSIVRIPEKCERKDGEAERTTVTATGTNV